MKNLPLEDFLAPRWCTKQNHTNLSGYNCTRFLTGHFLYDRLYTGRCQRAAGC